MPRPSYSHGTVGSSAARRDHRREPRAAPPRASATARRWSTCPAAAAGPTRELDADGRPRSRAACSPTGIEQGRPGRHLGAELRRVGAACSTPPREIGAILVNINPAYRTPRAGLRAAAVRREAAGQRRAAFKTSDYRGDGRGGRRATCPALTRGRTSARDDWDALLAAGRRGARAARRARWPTLSLRRPDQHPVHLGHHRLPQGRDAVAPQHPQQRLLRRRAAAATPSADRVCVPVPFYHCFGMVHGQPGGHHARRLHRHPRAGLRPGGDAARRCRPSAAPSLYGVPTMFIAELADAGLRRLRPVHRCAPGSWPARRARSR